MYFIFQAEICSWHNSTVQAWSREDVPYQQIKPHWWLAKPLLNPLPQVRFVINPKAPKPDNFFTGTDLDLYSLRLINLIREAEIKFESFPITIFDRNTMEMLPFEYELFHILEMYPSFDMSLSEVNKEASTINKLILTEQCLASGKLLFRATEKKRLTLIHKNLKEIFDRAGITGCLYTPVEEYKLL